MGCIKAEILCMLEKYKERFLMELKNISGKTILFMNSEFLLSESNTQFSYCFVFD